MPDPLTPSAPAPTLAACAICRGERRVPGTGGAPCPACTWVHSARRSAPCPDCGCDPTDLDAGPRCTSVGCPMQAAPSVSELYAVLDGHREAARRARGRHSALLQAHTLLQQTVRESHEEGRVDPTGLRVMVSLLDQMISAGAELRRCIEAIHTVEEQIERILDAEPAEVTP